MQWFRLKPPLKIVCVSQIYLRIGWVIKSPRVVHSVLYCDFFYWPNFILLPLKSLKMPVQHLSVLSASKNNYCVNEYKCCFASKLSAKTLIGKIQQCCEVIFTDSLLASLSHRSM